MDVKREVEGDSSASQVETEITVASGWRLGPYEIQHLLGAGGMGEVYQAVDTRLGRTVAIKVLPRQLAGNPSLKLRLLREACAASALNHPNIVGLYDISSHEGADFLVMEYVAGKTLKELIPSGGLAFDEVAGLGSQIALALGAAHAAGIVHRDIKPANILVTPLRQVKVVDFGIARLPDGTASDLTREGQIVGTVSYMSPEQTRGEHVDARSDIFSLGCVLYEAATGQRPFDGASSLAIMHAIATSDAAPPGTMRPDLPAEFDRLVARCLLKDPHQRAESAIELATELKSLTLPASVMPRVSPKRPSLAVIPFQLRGPDADKYLSVSLADAVIHRLSSSGKLIVRPIGSVMRYAGKDNEWAKVARELNVDLIVEGVIQTMGPKVRVLLQAHRASDAHTLASIKQDGDTGDLFGLQDRICDAVSDVFVPRDKALQDKRLPSTRHPGAYELYLRAVDRQLHLDKYDMASAIEMLTRATELEPGFADAWGLLAQAYAQVGSHLDPDPKWFDLGEQAIARTLELDPVQCDALCARSIVLFSPSRRFQNRAALRALNAAIKINPLRQIARHYRAAVLWHLGFLDASTQDAEELRLANPALAFPLVHLAQIAMQRGDFQQAIDFHAQALSLDPGQVLAHLSVPVPLLWAGRLAEARKALDNTRQILPDETFVEGLEAIFAALDGNFARAEALADKAANSGKSLTHTHHTWHYCAGAYALCGKPEKSLAELQRCGELGLPSYRIFEIDPHLRSLRTNPAFRELMTALRREHDSIRDEFGLDAEAG